MATSHPSQPKATFGQRLLPTVIDDIANEDPRRLFGCVPNGSTYSHGTRHISFADFARSINIAAWWLEENLGESTGLPTVAYIGPNDPRYYILCIASMKVGYQLLLLSPRNSVAGHAHLIDKTNCHVFLKGSTTSIDHILSERPMKSFNVPELADLLQEKKVPTYPFRKTFEEARNDPAIILHSSGSTGPPKPITLKQGSLCSVDAHHLLPKRQDMVPFVESLEMPAMVFTMLPLFHMAAMISTLINIYFNLPSVFPPPSAPLNINMLLDVVDNVPLDCCFVPPSIVEELSHSSESLARLHKVKWMWYGGGPLGKAPGDIVSKYTKLSSIIGTTESAYFPLYARDPEDWQYFRFNPDLKGVEFRESGDGLYEMFFVRDPDTDKFHSTWYTFPDLKEYSTADLYEKHPTKPDLWLHAGRVDDVLALNNGEKVVVRPLEDSIRECPEVKEVLLLGHARFEVAALIQLEEDAQGLARSELLKRLSAYVKHANDVAPKFARLSKDHITFTRPDKPMRWLPKGTVSRKATLMVYEKEIDAVYSGESPNDIDELPPLLKDNDRKSTINALLEIFGRVSDIQDLRPDQDVFRAGFDSLQVLSAARQVKAQLQVEKAPFSSDLVTPSLVYSNPTIAELADALRSLAEQPSDPEALKELRFKRVEAMLAAYSADMPKKSNRVAPQEDRLTFVLTGSTGSMGSYLLDILASSSRVEHIYCLNRAENGEKRQKSASSSRQLSTSWSNKVTFLHTDFSKPQFGLSSSDYHGLTIHTSYIIHNQWQVDFNLALSSFEPHVLGVRRIIDFAADAPKQPPILFTSTVSTVGNWAAVHPGSKAPEKPIHDLNIPFPIGYGESKHIAERILETAAESGVSAAICRVGQVAGPVEKGGMWNKQEWLPSIIASSAYLSLLPSSLGAGAVSAVDWIPVDTVASILFDLALHQPTSNPFTSFYQLSNPNISPWSSLIPAILSRLPAATKVVSWDEWVQALKDSAEVEHADPIQNPGIKLLDFYYGMSTGSAEGGGIMETEGTVAASETMKGLKAVGGEWMGKWMEQWGFGERKGE